MVPAGDMECLRVDVFTGRRGGVSGGGGEGVDGRRKGEKSSHRGRVYLLASEYGRHSF
jgi:hypothetical protein